MKQTAITISMINNINTSNKHDEQRMTSLEIAQLTGKRHSDTMRAIRNMEPAWEKVNGRKFALVDYQDQKGEFRPCYSLTKTETLYIGKPFGLEGRDLNSFLADQGIIQWANGQWNLTSRYLGLGLTESRSFCYHGRDGRRKYQSRLVWTEAGRQFILDILRS